MKKTNLFLNMIKLLRQEEQVLLYQNIFKISEDEKEAVLQFLEIEYQKEVLSYPFSAPPFHEKAALWAAEMVYIIAQLILYRVNNNSELNTILPSENIEITASSILSIDLCFRFIPDMLQQLKVIEADDELIPIVEKALSKWHYSGINYPLEIEDQDLELILSNRCLNQLYINRIISFKNKELEKHPFFKDIINSIVTIQN